MMELLGVKRAIILGSMVAINVLIVVLLFLLIMPMKDDTQARLDTAKSEISRLQTEIQNIKTEMQTLKETLPQYDALAGKGFFNAQDRFFISRTLEDLKNRSQLFGFSFTIQSLREIANADAATANRRVVASRIQFEKVSSLLDTGFFDFMDKIETTFPQHARIVSFDLKKDVQVSEDVLKRLATTPVSLITGELVMDWITMTDIPPAPVPGVGGP